jgi:hypothetical protein
LLFWGEVARLQVGETLQVESCVGEVGFVLHLFGDRLIVCSLERTWINLRQKIARLDVLTFGESDLYQFAIDPRLDGNRIERLHRAETGQVDRHVPPLRRGNRHRDRRRGRR